MVTYWENSLAYDMFSWYKYIIVDLVFPASVFGVGIFF